MFIPLSYPTKNVFQFLFISNVTGYPGITGTFLHYMVYITSQETETLFLYRRIKSETYSYYKGHFGRSSCIGGLYIEVQLYYTTQPTL